MKTKMALAVSLLFAVVIALFAVFIFTYLERSFKKAITDQQYAMVSNLAINLDDKLRMAHNALITRSHGIPAAVINDPDQAQHFLDDRSALLSMFDNGLFLISRSGKLIAETPNPPNRRGIDLSSSYSYRQTMETAKPCISKPYFSSHNPGHPAIFLSAPIVDSKGHLIAILGASIDLWGFNFLHELTSARIGQTGYFYLSDQNRIMISHPDKSRIMTPVLPVGKNPLYEKALTGFEGSGETTTT
ncbi:MAG: cache domain-containing protein, partial [Pelobacteraceae bacterium]